jgi:hypothetical protein
MITNRYSVFFYNTGYEKSGFSSISDALDCIKTACFEACVQNENQEVIAAWSPIGGMRYMRE